MTMRELGYLLQLAESSPAYLSGESWAVCAVVALRWEIIERETMLRH